MATRSSDKDLENGIQVALDAADTASGVTEEFNSVREQFEVVNIQAKRIYQSVLIVFISAITAAVISIGAGLLMYYKALGTLKTILLNSDKDELIDLLIISFNKAIEDADYVNENELKNTALNVFPEMGK